MFKKILGGFSLLIFVLTFAIPSLVITNTANSDDNRVDYYLYRVHLTCPDGSVIGSYDEWRSVSWTDSNHPEPYCEWQEFCHKEWRSGKEVEVCKWVYVCNEPDHWTTYRLYSTPTHTKKYMSERACR